MSQMLGYNIHGQRIEEAAAEVSLVTLPHTVVARGEIDTAYLKRVEARAEELIARGVRRRNAYRVAQKEMRRRRA